MKKLSIEEKAKAYDEAIDKAREYWDSPRTCIDIDVLVELFPELAESEDERIRKELLNYLYDVHDDDEERARWIAWLEKQGEQKPAWSEEDETGLGDALWAIQQARTIAKDENDMGSLWCAESWLKSLKDRCLPQPKQEWSEQDEKVLHAIRNALNYEKPRNYLKSRDFEFTDILDWLNSIKDRYTWKPSELQIEALAIAIRCGIKLGTWEEKALKDLIEQLKKLKE